MDDKELIRKVKNSFKAKKSRAEVLQGFQKRGYKLAYADALMRKANRPKKITITLAIILIVFISLTFSAYTMFSGNQKMQLSNPLTGFTITGNTIAHQQPSEPQVSSQPTTTNQIPKTVDYDQIDITPDFISFLLNEIGAWELHKNPLTFQKPIINFKIDDKNFYSEIDGKIKTFEGLSDSSDLQFNTNKKDIIDAVMSNTPDQIFKQSVTEGKTQIELMASEPELFAKGYLKLYNSLK